MIYYWFTYVNSTGISYETTEIEGGEVKVVMTGVQEQRLSGLGIHTLIAISLVFGRAQLQKIPNAVLTGIFLYINYFWFTYVISMS